MILKLWLENVGQSEKVVSASFLQFFRKTDNHIFWTVCEIDFFFARLTMCLGGTFIHARCLSLSVSSLQFCWSGASWAAGQVKGGVAASITHPCWIQMRAPHPSPWVSSSMAKHLTVHNVSSEQYRRIITLRTELENVLNTQNLYQSNSWYDNHLSPRVHTITGSLWEGCLCWLQLNTGWDVQRGSSLRSAVMWSGDETVCCFVFWSCWSSLCLCHVFRCQVCRGCSV